MERTTSDLINFTCPICLNITVEPSKTDCNHIFCFSCLEELIENSPSEDIFKCPMCREIIKSNFELKIDDCLENEIKNKFPSEYSTRKKLLDDHRKTQINFIKLKFLYGNTHKLVENPKPSRTGENNQNKHHWICFVKLQNDDIKKYVRKVIFGMHPTFGATEIEVKSPPFQISRIGWGTFEIPIKIYFHHSMKIKDPLEVAHNLSFNGAGETKFTVYKLNKEIYEKLNNNI